ncbi:MAG: FAD-binding protein [Cellvibrionaceae bacterium]|nr:FAD-binding protein [Cellvibrionaceae bacterium]
MNRAWATFDTDGLSTYHQMPLVCVLPSTREQVSEILKYAGAEGIPIVPRGAGTLAVGRRAAARGWRPDRHERIQAHPGHRLREWLRGGGAGRHQPQHHQGGRGPTGSITRPIRPARSPAPSAAMSPRTAAGCTA